ncbi:long-chain fatty acid--CoA ligase [Aquabacterium lacunae]|uniref:Long-chain fatty acid--CoA ligase n=1 Tax=Aquabacterium lacunae TaxID=2528630 RepID=A0A4Q9GXN2_9BURK|nr:long-chain fatty acid--CoA ligase [Aquabacterium lacunae]TBO30367.1 long-chain fatty acid--CoA ligase [Aquabacterium lacunae]
MAPHATAPHHAFWPARLPRTLTVPETPLWHNLTTSAARYPHKAAYLFAGASLSYTELLQQAEALAGWLQQVARVEPGERVLLFMQNCPQYVVSCYAILRARAVVVPVNPMNKADEFGHYISDADARVALCTAELAQVVHSANEAQPAHQRLQHLLVTRYADAMPPTDAPDSPMPSAMQAWLRAEHPLPAGATAWAQALQAEHTPAPYEGQSDDLALLPYTSGTTGLPKGCMHSHRSLMHNAVGSGLWGHVGADSVTLGVVPLFHITGMLYGVLTPVLYGSTVVLMPRWDRELAAALIAQHQVSHWTCIPTMIMDLFGSPNYPQFNLSSLRFLSGGGAAMPEAVAQRLKDEFGISFAEGYGLTETSAPSHANPPERAKLQCLGMPMFGTDSRVVDPVTLQDVPTGEVGEIITSGPMVFQGYWKHPEATAAAFIEREGRRYFRTGDLGRVDDEGYFFITDRLKRMINASGFKVWPSEVEMLLYRHPAVLEACVIASRDAYRGETVKAVLVLRPEARGTTQPDDIIGWAKDHMAAYKYPRIVEFADGLPKSGAGKVLWRVLQAEEDRKAQAAEAT